MDGYMDRQMDRWINRWIDRQIDRWMDRQMDINKVTSSYIYRWIEIKQNTHKSIKNKLCRNL